MSELPKPPRRNRARDEHIGPGHQHNPDHEQGARRRSSTKTESQIDAAQRQALSTGVSETVAAKIDDAGNVEAVASDAISETAKLETAPDDKRAAIVLPSLNGFAYRIQRDSPPQALEQTPAFARALRDLPGGKGPILTLGDMRLEIPHGLSLIVGGPSTGKTTLIHTIGSTGLLSNARAALLLVDEPIFAKPATHWSRAFDMAFEATTPEWGVAVWASKMITEHGIVDETLPPPVLFADSFRAVPYEAKGGAAEKGIVTAAFIKLTRYSNALARAGLRVVAILNPMDEDDALNRAFLSRADASAPMLISLTNKRGTQTSGQVTNRLTDRRWENFEFASAYLSSDSDDVTLGSHKINPEI